MPDPSGVDRLRLLLAGRKPCDICEGTEWRGLAGTIDANPSHLLLGAAWPDGTPVDGQGFEVLAMACVQCGNVRMFVADLLSLSDELNADRSLTSEPPRQP